MGIRENIRLVRQNAGTNDTGASNDMTLLSKEPQSS